MAPSLRVEVSPVDVRDAAEIERAVTAFARASNGGLIVTPGAASTLHRHLIVTLATRHKLPAVYNERHFAAAGGLVSYGADQIDQYRRAAGYVDRILKGEKPADLPVQAPTKYETGGQPQDRQGARPHRAAVRARPRRRGDRMKRREFITLLGGAAAWPLVARAQQPAMPVVGFLSGFSPSGGADTLAAFRQGLSDTGYIEHQNVGIEYRWAEGRYDRLPAMAADLVRRQVAVICTNPTAAALAAKAATMTIPVVFLTAGDPVQLGLVASLARPGGNVTGATFYVAQLASRQLELLHRLLPNAAAVGVLRNPNAAANAEPQIRDLQSAANALGLRLHVLDVASEGDANAAIASLVGERADALFVTADGYFQTQLRDPIVALAARHSLPTMYPYREFVEAGGLICYTSSSADAARQVGVYAGRILKGAKLAELPVTQPTRYKLVVNLKTAKALGLDVPPTLLATADEVIE